MKLTHSLPLISLLAVLFTAGVVRSHDGKDHGKASPATAGKLVPIDDKTGAAWIAKARANYPVTICVVSDEKLEDHGTAKAQEFIYKEDGRPDRFLRFCCKDCATDFSKDPAKYIKMIDDAAASKAKAGK